MTITTARERPESAWKVFRGQFPIFGRQHFMDSAYYNPVAEPVRQAVNAVLLDMQAGRAPSGWKAILATARGRAANVIGATPGNVALVKNTSEAMNAVANALQLQSGHNVVVAGNDHPITMLPWRNLERRGVEVRTVDRSAGLVRIGAFSEAIDHGTRAVVVSSVQYDTGQRVNVRGLADLTHRVGGYLILDAIQEVGAAKVDVRDIGVDALACGGHKWVLGIHGAGFLFCSDRLLDEAHPAYVAREGMVPEANPSEVALLSDARRFEIGNANYAGFAGLSAGIDLLLGMRLEVVEKRILELGSALLDELARLGITPLTPRRTGERLGIVAFRDSDPQRIVQACEDAGVRVALRRGAVRVSLHAYNTEDDIEALMTVLRTMRGRS